MLATVKSYRLIPARAGKTPPQSAAPRCQWAHPRAGGENVRRLDLAKHRRGSSPRGRGKRHEDGPRELPGRLIPARAGKTGRGTVGPDLFWAHPRAGGENLPDARNHGRDAGSSPRGRGKRDNRTVLTAANGLIPARAGKTPRCRPRHLQGAAHPRAGGENDATNKFADTLRGSSPRGRGKHQPRRVHYPGDGLIPARAGKTSPTALTMSVSGAHPRAGGENSCAPPRTPPTRGSSPRGRGKPRSGPRARRLRRLIPARAGKTENRRMIDDDTSAHPRAGGENEIRQAGFLCQAGSSPRGRGKPRRSARGGRVRRLIPARAGKTPSSSSTSSAMTAHPRAGGENESYRRARRAVRGSSPRGRGKRATA